MGYVEYGPSMKVAVWLASFPIVTHYDRIRSMATGTEWLIDARDCRADELRDLSVLRRLCEDVIEGLQLTVVGAPVWHKFPCPGGVTGMYLLSESHLTCHTYPEFGLATFNLYCCRPRPVWPWADRLTETLGASEVVVQAIPRGVGEPPLSVGLLASAPAREDA